VFGGSWRLGRLFGVEIRVDVSWVFIAVLVIFSLHDNFQSRYPDLTASSALLLAIAFGLLFFGSVLAHEMAHAVTAKRRGIEVHGITLFLFGGATHAKIDSRRPQDELVVSVLGPLTSLVLGGLFLLLTYALGGTDQPVLGGFRYLGGVNILLAVFNMLPGFPLDGGRVLRALVWRSTGSLARATRIASIAGQAVGYLMAATGLLILATNDVVGGIWIAAIGWFLAQAARMSGRERPAPPREEVEAAPSEPRSSRG
jgi:Zn-dependent protease